MRDFSRRRRRSVVRCTLCGREITAGEEYWASGGHQVCGECLPEFARWELASCRVVCGEEAVR